LESWLASVDDAQLFVESAARDSSPLLGRLAATAAQIVLDAASNQPHAAPLSGTVWGGTRRKSIDRTD